MRNRRCGQNFYFGLDYLVTLLFSSVTLTETDLFSFIPCLYVLKFYYLDKACKAIQKLKKNWMTCRKKLMSQGFLPNAETKISAGLSRITGPAELNEMVQYKIQQRSIRFTKGGSKIHKKVV